MKNDETNSAYQPSNTDESNRPISAYEHGAPLESSDKRLTEEQNVPISGPAYLYDEDDLDESRDAELVEGTASVEHDNITGEVIRPSDLRIIESPIEVFDPWAIRGLQDAFKAKDKQPPWVVKELLMSHTATAVSAQPHAMKSLSWLAACMQAPLTGKVWGHFDAPKVDSTLFIETEDPQWLVEARIVGLAKGLGLAERKGDIPGFHYACVGPFNFLGERERLEDLIEKYQPKFIVLSTLQNLLEERNWSSQHDMQPIMAMTIQLSRLCPIVLVTHSPQNSKQRRPAGSITQAANFATLLHHQKTGGTSVNVRIDSKAGMGGRAFSLRLVTEGPADDPGSVRELLYDGVAQATTGTKRKAVEALLASDPGAKPVDIADQTKTSVRYVQRIKREAKSKK